MYHALNSVIMRADLLQKCDASLVEPENGGEIPKCALNSLLRFDHVDLTNVVSTDIRSRSLVNCCTSSQQPG